MVEQPQIEVIESLISDNPHILDISRLLETKDSIEFLMTLTSFDHSPEIIKQMVEIGFRLKEVREKVPSLEEIYLKLVEEEK